MSAPCTNLRRNREFSQIYRTSHHNWERMTEIADLLAITRYSYVTNMVMKRNRQWVRLLAHIHILEMNSWPFSEILGIHWNMSQYKLHTWYQNIPNRSNPFLNKLTFKITLEVFQWVLYFVTTWLGLYFGISSS